MKWVYYDYMGNYNPVCEDAGEILKIIPNTPPAPYTNSNISEIETPVGAFGCDTKFDIVRVGGFCLFGLINDPDKNLIFVDIVGVKHGQTVRVTKNDVLMYGENTLTPITTDPRILCIMHRAHGLKDDALPEFCKRIPTRDEAVAYLRSIGAQMECLPMVAVKDILNKERK